MARPRASRALENAARDGGCRFVAGVDEVGRGCLAGPVVAAAVVIDVETYVRGVADSKVLSAAARERAFTRIRRVAVACEVGMASAEEIDRLNIHRASLLAMRRAVLALRPAPELVLVDGFAIPDLPFTQQAIVGGDRTSRAIAAASIIAKVTRDQLMAELHARDPRYGFDRHKGYATLAHIEAVTRYGYSSEHRRTFRPPSLFDTIAE